MGSGFAGLVVRPPTGMTFGVSANGNSREKSMFMRYNSTWLLIVDFSCGSKSYLFTSS